MASGISGMLLFVALIVFIININEFTKNPYTFIMILSTLGIGFGIHGLSHNLFEIYYDFNPLENKWKCKLKNV
jgi:hypothetical protein